MSLHNYACPACGVSLQSGQDVTGRKVRCLGCQTVFVARSESLPAPSARTRRPSRPEPDEPARPALPPIPKSRKVPAAAVVVVVALIAAVGLTAFIVKKYKGSADPKTEPAVAEKPKDKAQTPAKGVSATTPLADRGTEPPPARNVEVEEDPVAPVVPARNPGSEVTEAAEPTTPKPVDRGPILPKLPGPGLTGPTVSNPPPSPPPVKPTEPKPVETKPADPVELGPRGDGQIPAALLASLKAATVFVKTDAGTVGGTGTGFVVRVSGDTALIVTNQHVVEIKTKQGVIRNAAHEVVFHSGRKNEFTRKADLIATDAEHDLAVLRVSGVRTAKDFPTPLNHTDKTPLSETMPVYILGFPFGEGLSTTRGNPALTIGKGTISSLREDETGDAAFIQIDGDINPGNSGGPVVDGRGRLVGVTRAKVVGTGIGMAIPRIELTRMMGGRVSDLDFRIARVSGGTVEVEVRGGLVDPLNRVSSATLRVVRADDMKKKPAVGADGKWSVIEGSKKMDLRISGNAVTGTVALPVRDRDRGKIEIFFQPSCVDKDGKTHFFGPVPLTLVQSDGRPDGGPFPGPGGFPMGPGAPGMPPGAGPIGPVPPMGVPPMGPPPMRPAVPGRPG